MHGMRAKFHEIAEKVRRGEPLPWAWAAVLSAAVPVVRLGMWRRLRQPRERVEARVISFGNITAGGTGKTPAVIERARAELNAGHHVAVLTRGYGSRGGGQPELLMPGKQPNGAHPWLGDEPALIARRAPGVVVVRCRDRVAGAWAAIEQTGCDTLILDDGFQYVRLERDENIVLIDATNPFGNGCLLPRGIMREPLEALARATQFILTRCDQARDLAELKAQLAVWCPYAPIRCTRHAPTELWRVSDGAHMPAAELRERQVSACCAIGNPDAFFHTLEDLGARLETKLAFPDHGVIPIEGIPTKTLVITTEKDAMRMSNPPDNVWALGIELQDLEEE